MDMIIPTNLVCVVYFLTLPSLFHPIVFTLVSVVFFIALINATLRWFGHPTVNGPACVIKWVPKFTRARKIRSHAPR